MTSLFVYLGVVVVLMVGFIILRRYELWEKDGTDHYLETTGHVNYEGYLGVALFSSIFWPMMVVIVFLRVVWRFLDNLSKPKSERGRSKIHKAFFEEKK